MLEKLILEFQSIPDYITISDGLISEPQEGLNGVVFNTIERSCSVSAGAPTIKVAADIRLARDGSFGWIDAVNTRVSWSGITLGLGISNQWSISTIYPGNRKVDVKGGATVDVYLISEIGGIVVYSTPKECSFSYSI